MLHPELTEAHELIHFRSSQRKFNATENNTFSMVDYSMPYAFARLNSDIVVLLHSLGITTEKFLSKQQQYHKWISDATKSADEAFNFLSATGQYEKAERVLLDGLDSEQIQSEIRRVQRSEIAAFKKNDRPRVRTRIPKSRLLFGVCDPYGVLREGEVFVRICVPRMGATTLTNIDLLVVRNPCLHPGDCLKLRAVDHPRLRHLVDCIVFATKGRRAAPSMSSGGDLGSLSVFVRRGGVSSFHVDGDRFTVIWDPDLVPAKIAEVCIHVVRIIMQRLIFLAIVIYLSTWERARQ